MSRPAWWRRLANVSPWPAGRIVAQGEYGSLSRQHLDVYVPRREGGHWPVVVFFYGGRWKSGDRRLYDPLARSLAAAGIVVVVPDYRLYPEVRFPAFVQDGAAAVAWVMSHIHRFGGDPRRVYLMGHSAGAHIGSMLALDARYLGHHSRKRSDLAGFIGLAGPYDFLPFQTPELADTFGPEEQHRESQPIHWTDGNNPPFLLLHGSADNVVGAGNSKRLWRKIESSGGRARMVFFSRANHTNILFAAAVSTNRVGPVQREIYDFVVQGGSTRLPDPPSEFCSYD
ncbi:MAG: alpha/beta hydrolase [Pseudomonadota bacterium]|nr:alpha/beta hydrolase [Pseudomonadota bacterium]